MGDDDAYSNTAPEGASLFLVTFDKYDVLKWSSVIASVVFMLLSAMSNVEPPQSIQNQSYIPEIYALSNGCIQTMHSIHI